MIGLLIAYNPKVFQMIKYATVDYDDDPLCTKTWITSNIGQIMALKHVDHPEFGIVIGNTHLYWRPVALYERLRQTAIFINKIMNAQNGLQETEPNTKWVPIPIGGMHCLYNKMGDQLVIGITTNIFIRVNPITISI